MFKSKSFDDILDKIQSAVNKRQDQLSASKEEQDSLKAKLKELETAITSALDNSDYEYFKSASEEKARTEFQIKVLDNQIKELSKPEKLADYRELWKEFSDSYEKAFLTMQKEYVEERHKLYERFQALVTLQEYATTIRHRIGINCGFSDYYGQNLDISEYSSIGMITGLQKVPVRNTMIRHSPDSAFFIATGEMPEAEDDRVYRVVSLKQ